MQDQPQIAALYAALVKAQGDFLPITKNRDGQKGNRNFKYADLEELIRATRPALTSNSLAVMQPIRTTEGGGQELVTMLVHESGATVQAAIRLSGDYTSMQDYGAGITFLRRYAYQAILCISADDDLDNGDGGTSSPTQKAEPQHASSTSSTEARETPKTCDPAWFTSQLPGWTAAVAQRKSTPERIISLVESRAKLTEAQRKTIMELKPAHIEGEQQE